MTIVFNSVYCVLEAVELGEVPRDKACIGVLFLSTCKGILVFRGSFDLLLGCFLLCLFCNDANMHQVGVSGEQALDCVELVCILVVQGREWLKFEILTGGVVEILFWELKFIGISNAHSDVVIILHTFDTTPKHQFFEVVSLRSVQQDL